MPSCDLWTEDITNELFGDWKSPFPTPNRATNNPTVMIELPICKVEKPTWAITMTSNPANVNSSDPILSESAPLSGAEIAMVIGNNISKNPALTGDRCKIFCV
jgi:hypothetical protein